MGAVELDLRTLLEQGRAMVLELLELSRKLILELGTAHHWTMRSLDVFGQLANICSNLDKLISANAGRFDDPKHLFAEESGLKLWKTAVGFWRALPPERTRLNEQLARRRRQRIMGENVEDAGEFSKEIFEEAIARYREAHSRLEQQYRDLGAQIARIPAGIAPTAEELAAPPAPVAAQAAAALASPPPPPPVAGPAQSPAVMADDDELTPA